MKLRLSSLLLGTSAAIVLTLGAPGCSRRATEAPPEPAPPPPVAVSEPIEALPPVETPPPAVTVPEMDPVYFDFDSHLLAASARDVLDHAAKLMRDRPELEVTIEGHCDERGASEYNMALGERRASAAREYLLASGVANERIRTISYGEERPFVESHDEAAWAMNRRAHFNVRLTPVERAATTED